MQSRFQLAFLLGLTDEKRFGEPAFITALGGSGADMARTEVLREQRRGGQRATALRWKVLAHLLGVVQAATAEECVRRWV